MAARRGSKLVYAIILIFGLIAFSLSIAGERRRGSGTLRTDPITNQRYCVYKTDVATGFGIVACLFLLAAQVMLMVVTRCLCCGSLAAGGSRACAIILFIVMWISYFIAEACLIAAAKDYSHYDGYRTPNYTNGYSCASLRRWLFVAGAIFTISTMILNILYYMCFTRAAVKHIQQGNYPANSNIGMTARG